MSSDYIPMTQAGYNKIRAEIEQLELVEMPRIAEKIAEARAEGDLKENAEYHGQRERQGQMQAKINYLKSKLAKAAIVDPSKLAKDEVVFGCTVTVKDLQYGDEEEYTLVGAGEEDYDQGKILVTSPIGMGLIGKKVGQTAEIKAPKGVIRFEVVRIRFNLEE
jgi:transcription elongation factor GreA